jgi:DNA-binding response OmpR family regulator
VVQFTIGAYSFDYQKQKLSAPGLEVKLTTKENELMYLLCKNKNGIMERGYALKAIWGDDNYFNGRSMDVYIAKLRKHLKNDSAVEIINIHGKGFKLLAP